MGWYATASSAPRWLATMASSLVCVLERSSCSSTCTVSAIWGMALGDTKLPKSRVSKPTWSRELM